MCVILRVCLLVASIMCVAFSLCCVCGGGGAGTCFNFHSGRGGDPPLDPLPPSPLSSSAAENLGFGNLFSHGKKFFGACHTLCTYCSMCAPYYLVFQTAMPQRSLSVYFSSPVPLLPRAKREDVIDALLYFRFKVRITSHKRQKAYNEAQKACATLFLSIPMATLCDNLSDVSHSGSHSGSSSSSGSSCSSSSSDRQERSLSFGMRW